MTIYSNIHLPTSPIRLHNVAATLPSTTDKQTLIVYISKLLGYSVSVGSLVTKIPQIIKIYNAGTVTGLSLSMYSIEVLTQYVSILYHYTNGYSISTYGENISFFCSNICILMLFVKYSTTKQQRTNALFALGIPIVLSALVYQPAELTTLQSCATPLYILSRLPQIYSNYKTKSTGQLSSTTFAANFIGSVIRIITTATQLDNNLVLQTMFVTSCMCNAILLGQIYTYQNNTARVDKVK